MIDLAKIEAAAKAATPGKREVEDPLEDTLSVVLAGKPTYEWFFLANCSMPDEDDHGITGSEVKANVELIALLDRETILALVAVVRAAQKMKDRLDFIHADPAYKSVWTVNQLHMGEYKGPQYTEEIHALQKALTPFTHSGDKE